jgi:hypothetical protein
MFEQFDPFFIYDMTILGKPVIATLQSKASSELQV